MARRYREVTVTREREGECPVGCGGCSCHLSPPCGHCLEHGPIEEEISVECRFTPEGDSYYSHSFGNYLPGEPADFDWDASTVTIDGRQATAAEVREIEEDASLMLKFEEEARFNND